MMITEAEAKTKACCKTMPNKPDGRLVTAACLGSECMAWRWGSTMEEYAKNLPGRPGYCGLAGRPE